MNKVMRTGIVKMRVVAIAAILTVACLVTHAQEATLSVSGEVKNPLKLTMTDLKAMPSARVTAKDHDGTTAVYEGVPLYVVLSKAAVPQGESLRGEALQLVVLVKAADGYKAALSLAESDPMFMDKQVLLAYKRNAADLDAKTGPLRLVISDEKRQARWVRQVTELEIVRAGSSK
jgi:DMSO/TMAO reductase YedYZ molybdopterin-dependent catalytic subunit